MVPAAGTSRPMSSEARAYYECITEDWQAFGIEFDFTFKELVCLMSTPPDQTRDGALLAALSTKLDAALDKGDWIQSQQLLCVFVRSDPVHAVDAMCSNRLSWLAVRAARASESDHEAGFTRRLGKALAVQLDAFVELLSPPDGSAPSTRAPDGGSQSAEHGCGNDGAGGAAMEAMECAGGIGAGGGAAICGGDATMD